MMVKGTGDANGHYKGDLSGDTTVFRAEAAAWTSHPDSFLIDVVKQVQPQHTLAYCLYDSNCASPSTTFSESFLPDMNVMHIRVTDIEEKSSGIDKGSSPDFYPRMKISHQDYLDRILMDMASYDNSDYVIDGQKTEAWWFLYFERTSHASTDFKFEVWDYDNGFAGGDDHIDISTEGDNIDATYTYATGALSGDVSGVHTTIDTAVSSQGGNGDRAKVTFYVYSEPLIGN